MALNRYESVVAINQAISGVTPITSSVVELGPGQDTISGTVKTTGTVNGGWKVFVSNYYFPEDVTTHPGGAAHRFTEELSAALVAYLAVALGTAGGGFKPNGSAGTGTISILLPFQAVYFLFTPTAGSGDVTLDLNAS